MSEYPKEQKALKITKDQQHLELKTVPVRDDLQPNEILVRIHSSGVQVVDSYFLWNKWGTEGAGSGVELAGDVLKVGNDVTRFKVGDTIASFTFGTDTEHPENGGYQQYAKVLESNSFHFDLKPAGKNELDEGPIDTYEAAASSAGNLITTGVSIFHIFGAKNKEQGKTLLVYGGATSTGKFAITYAHYIGWRVIAIASSKHHDDLKKKGADVVVDYHTDDLTKDIVALGENIDYVYITAGGKSPVEAIHKALPVNRPIKVETLQVADFSFIKDVKPNVKYGFTRAFTSHGSHIRYAGGGEFAPIPGTLESIKEWVIIVEKLTSAGLFTHYPVKVLPHGLNSVIEGLELLNTGELGNTRLVVRPQEE